MSRGTAGRLLLASAVFAAGVLVVSVMPAHAATARTIHVNTTKDLLWQANACASASGGKCSLRAAIAQANMDNANDLILVPGGTYPLTQRPPDTRDTPTGSGGLTDLNINAPMSIQGAGAGSTVVDGKGTYRVMTAFNSKGGTISIASLTLTGGGESLVPQFGSGGGLEVSAAATVVLRDAVVSNNHVTGFGGGIDNHGVLTVTRTQITGNSSVGDGTGMGGFQGPGGGLSSGGTTTVQYSTIDHNDALRGGGIDVGGSLYLIESTVYANTARNSGGGVRNRGLTRIKFSTITGNCSGSSPSCSDPSAGTSGTDNEAVGGRHGGGVVNIDGSMIIGGTAIAGNQALDHDFPRSDDCYAPHAQTPIWSARNNFLGIWTAPCNWFDLVDSRYENAGDLYDLVGTWDAPWSPELGPFQFNGGPTPTLAPQSWSDLVDTADGQIGFGVPGGTISPDSWFECDPTDQRGLSRPVQFWNAAPTCDIGAVEIR